MRSWFIWKGKDSRSFGILTEKAAPIIKPEEKISRVTIPGRGGELTIAEGTDIYNSYIQTVTVNIPQEYLEETMAWLKGAGEVIFSSDPGKKQRARIIGAVTMAKRSATMRWWSGEVQFYCDPYKVMVDEEAEKTFTASGSIENDGEAACYPVITVTAASASNISCTVAGVTIYADLNGTGCSTVVIDTETGMITTADGNTNMGAYIRIADGKDLPMLAVGSNAVTMGTASQIKIRRRRRWVT